MKALLCGWLAVLALLLATAGCTTTPKINWAARVGNYTFDQAVTELGPPDKQAKLSDGTTVAEWVTQPSRTHAFATGGYYWPHGYGGFGATHMDTVSSPEYFLRLTFNPDGRLTAWKKLAR